MKRVAVFVDAGYLYAQGSACLQGNKAKRENIRLDHPVLIKILKAYVTKVQPTASLLRIYWYDGTSKGPTLDHRTLANLDDLKLRLGFINSVGQQKGVDSLLVTDLVELARNGAICDALLLGGDEDLRIGVQIAQSFGVRLHLIGIEPSRASQSLQLRQEVDTKHEIAGAQVSSFLSIVMPTPTSPLSNLSLTDIRPCSEGATAVSATAPTAALSTESLLDQGIDGVLASLDHLQITDLKNALENGSLVPAQYDRRVLASCRTTLGRDLTMAEKKMMRSRLVLRVDSASSK